MAKFSYRGDGGDEEGDDDEPVGQTGTGVYGPPGAAPAPAPAAGVDLFNLFDPRLPLPPASRHQLEHDVHGQVTRHGGVLLVEVDATRGCVAVHYDCTVGGAGEQAARECAEAMHGR